MLRAVSVANRWAGALLVAMALQPLPVHAAEVLVAVAANFVAPLNALESEFEAGSGHTLKTAIGSTGKLYAQVVKGAPFDVMLAADEARPRRLEAEGHAVAGSRFTYAVGRLALWSRDANRIGADGSAALKAGDIRRVAMANPDLAPYGLAALQTLQSLGLATVLADRIVMGENIGQVFAMVGTGNADLGFVAMSSLLSATPSAGGSYWMVPAHLHDPIRQDAVLLRHGAQNSAAVAFLNFLKSPRARATMARHGYGTE